MSNRPIRAALLQIHSILGLAVSLVLTMIGLTGATMAFEDEISASLNTTLLRVEARSVPMLTPDELIVRLQGAQDLGKVAAVTMASDPAVSVRIRFARNEDLSRPSSVYVDPYDARVLGVPRGDEFFATVRKLHRWLLIPGDGKGWGRTITGSVAICLIVMLITGLVLRWPRRARSVRIWLKPNLALQGRGFQWSLHSVIGTWVMLIYLTMALTGLWFSFEWYKAGATWLFAHAPVATTMPAKETVKAAPGSQSAEQTPSVGLNVAWFVFLKEQGHRYATAQLQLPNSATNAMRIRSWARDITHDGARDEYRINTITGRLISADIYADKTFGERVLASVLDIHRGSILGWPGKFLFMFAAALMPLFLVTGLLLYLSRRRLPRLRVFDATLDRSNMKDRKDLNVDGADRSSARTVTTTS